MRLPVIHTRWRPSADGQSQGKSLAGAVSGISVRRLLRTGAASSTQDALPAGELAFASVPRGGPVQSQIAVRGAYSAWRGVLPAAQEGTGSCELFSHLLRSCEAKLRS